MNKPDPFKTFAKVLAAIILGILLSIGIMNPMPIIVTVVYIFITLNNHSDDVKEEERLVARSLVKHDYPDGYTEEQILSDISQLKRDKAYLEEATSDYIEEANDLMAEKRVLQDQVEALQVQNEALHNENEALQKENEGLRESNNVHESKVSFNEEALQEVEYVPESKVEVDYKGGPSPEELARMLSGK